MRSIAVKSDDMELQGHLRRLAWEVISGISEPDPSNSNERFLFE